MEQVEEICDHIILMNQGRKILDGTVAGVKQEFKQNEFRISLDSPPPDEFVTDAFQVVERQGGQLIVKIVNGYRPNDVLRYFIDQGVGITSFTEILPSLNEIFIQLVEGTPTARQFQPL
jgi:ABC-2 type transport system ATP-binding protein